MATKRIKLPSLVPGEALATTSIEAGEEVVKTIVTQVAQTKRTRMETEAEVAVAKLAVAKEALSAVKSFLTVVKSCNELKATRVEWEGRVATAEAEVAKAEVDLANQKEKNAPKLEELRQDQQVLDRLLSLFDDIMNEMSGPRLSEEMKAKSRKDLLELSDKLVKMKR